MATKELKDLSEDLALEGTDQLILQKADDATKKTLLSTIKAFILDIAGLSGVTVLDGTENLILDQSGIKKVSTALLLRNNVYLHIPTDTTNAYLDDLGASQSITANSHHVQLEDDCNVAIIKIDPGASFTIGGKIYVILPKNPYLGQKVRISYIRSHNTGGTLDKIGGVFADNANKLYNSLFNFNGTQAVSNGAADVASQEYIWVKDFDGAGLHRWVMISSDNT